MAHGLRLLARRSAVLSLALAATLALGACQPEPSTGPVSPSATAPASGTPDPSPTPSPTEAPQTSPTVLFGGDCAAVLPPSTTPAELGEVTAVDGYDGGTAVSTLGGLSCLFGGDLPLQVMAFPRSAVADDIVDRYREPVCEGYGYDGYGCRVGRESGGMWSLTTLGPSQWGDEATPTPLLDATADAVAANIAAAAPPVPVDRTDAWWSATCGDLGADLDLVTILGVEDVESGYPADGGSDVATEIAVRAGSYLGYCAWYGFAGNELRAIQVWPYPGGAWAWERSADDLSEIETLPVAGATEARIGIDGTMAVADMTDGGNLVRVAVGEVDAAVPATLAAVMAALAG